MMPYSLGSAAVGTSAAQLLATATTFLRQVTLKAAHGNTATIYIGLSSSVTAGTNGATDGFELAAGDSLSLGSSVVNDLSNIYTISGSASQKVFWYAE